MYYTDKFIDVKGLNSSRYTYYNLRNAWSTVVSEMLTSYTWDWWVSLTSRKPMPLKVIRGRFFWWLKCLRKVTRCKPEFIWIIERQRRGALHVHAVISGIPSNNSGILWRGMINTWEYYNSKGGIRFGDATIKKFNPQKAGKLCWYLAKERCKDLDLLEGSGSVFEKMGYSRGVKRFLNTPSVLKKFIYGSAETRGPQATAHAV